MNVKADIAKTIPGEETGIVFLRRRGTPDDRTVVMLHGIGSHGASFAPLIDALPSTLDVVAWNAPGYGGSRPIIASHPTAAAYADALLRLLDALRLDRIVLLGHSLGCLFAANFAARYPDRVAALALLSPALGYRVGPNQALPETVQNRIDELRQLGPRDFAGKRAARLVYRPETKPGLVAGVRDAMAAVDPVGYMQAARALGTGDLLADAAQLQAKTLVAVGAQDVVTPPENARALYAALRHPAGYHEIAEAGHALPQEDPKAVAGLLRELVESTHA